MAAETQDCWDYTVSNDQVTITSYTGSGNTNVVIPSALGGKTVVAIGPAAFSSNTCVTSITIPATVTSIGNMAFAGETGLNRLIFKGDTPPTTIGTNIFGSSSMIPTIYVPKTAIAAYKNSFTNYTIQADMAGTIFQDNMNRDRTYRVNDDYTATLVSYSGYESIINLSSQAEYYDSISCSNTYYAVTAIEDKAFAGNTNLKRIQIPEGVKEIGANAFNCPNLEEVVVSSSTPCTISDGAFPSDGSYKIYVPKGNVNSYKTAWSNYADHICANPVGTTVEIGDYEYYYRSFGVNDATVALTSYNGRDVTVTIPKSFYYDGRSFNVEGIDDNAFDDHQSLQTVIFPSGWDYFSYTPKTLFSNCPNLSKVYIENNYGTLTFGAGCFAKCPSDLTFYVPNDKFEGYKASLSQYKVKVIPSTVYINDGNFSYTLNDDTKGVSVSSYMDSGSSEVVVPSSVTFTLEGSEVQRPVTGIKRNAISYSSQLNTLTIPESVTSIDSCAFRECYCLSTLKVLGKTPAAIGAELFGSYVTIQVPCGTLDAYTKAWPQYSSQLEENLAGATFTIGDYQYKADDNMNLTIVKYTGSESTVLIPENVVKGNRNCLVTAIADNAFAGNTSLAFVSIPANVVSIGKEAFKGCTSLSKVTVARSGSVATLGSDAFADCASGLVIYVPSDDLSTYQTSWSAYSSLIQASAAGTMFTQGYLSYKLLADLHHVAIVGNSYDSMNNSGKVFEIPETVENEGTTYTVSTIASNAFSDFYCQVIVPASVENVEDYAFRSPGFSTIKFLGNSTCMGYYAFGDSFSNLKTVLVPEDGYDYYQKNAYMLSSYLAVAGSNMALNDEEGLTKLTHNTYFEEGQLTYERTFADDAQYATLCLPFDFDPTAAGFEQVYTLMGNVIHYNPASAATGSENAGQQEKYILMLNKYSGTVSAGTPVFVKLGSSKNVKITNTNVATINSNSSPNGGNMLTVVDWDGTSGLMEQSNCYINYNGTFQSIDASSRSDLYTFNSDGTFGPQTSGTLSPFRMYLTVNSYSMMMNNCRVTIGLSNGSATGIQELVKDPVYNVSMPNAVYDLSGRIVSTTGSTQGLPKGIYIQNHKKIVVK